MPLPKDEVFGYLESVDGERIALGHDAYADLRARLQVIQGGKVRGKKPDPLITTGQVAEILGYSRRTVTRLLDAGEIPYQRIGNGHRKVRVSDVVLYKEMDAQRRHEGLEELRRIYFEAGMNDLDMIEEYLSQFE